MTLSEMEEMMLGFCHLIDNGIEAMRVAGKRVAIDEQVYREARKEAWPDAVGDNVDQRKAWVDAKTAEFKSALVAAENLRQDAIEAVRARRGQLSALQTLMSAHRAEAEFVRTGPQ